MKLLFLTHDSSLNKDAQKCLFDLIKDIKTDFLAYHIYMIFSEERDMIKKCSSYLRGYKIRSRNWWLTCKGIRSKEKRNILKKTPENARKNINYYFVIIPKNIELLNLHFNNTPN